MKNTGVIRKIDELGRIVIPKEIRKSLNIRNGEDIQIYVEDESIILKKYKKMFSFKESAQKYLDIFAKLTNSTILITDKENVIASTDMNLNNCLIDSKIIDLINDRKVENGKSIYLGEKPYDKYYYVNPIIIDADAIGSVILLSEKDINEQQIILAKVINILMSSLIY